MPETQETQVQSLGWEDPLEKEWQPTPAFMPGKYHEQRSLTDYNPWGCKALDDDWACTHIILINIAPNVFYKNCATMYNYHQQSMKVPFSTSVPTYYVMKLLNLWQFDKWKVVFHVVVMWICLKSCISFYESIRAICIYLSVNYFILCYWAVSFQVVTLYL